MPRRLGLIHLGAALSLATHAALGLMLVTQGSGGEARVEAPVPVEVEIGMVAPVPADAPPAPGSVGGPLAALPATQQPTVAEDKPSPDKERGTTDGVAPTVSTPPDPLPPPAPTQHLIPRIPAPTAASGPSSASSLEHAQTARPVRSAPARPVAMPVAKVPGDAMPAMGLPPGQSGDGRPTASSAVSASTNEWLPAYARLLRARIEQVKPKGVASPGVTVVTFTVASDGSLATAEISSGSGNARLDRTALDAIRAAAPFPFPPAGATATQRTFVVPYRFQ